MRIIYPQGRSQPAMLDEKTGGMFHYFCRFTLNVWMPDDRE